MTADTSVKTVERTASLLRILAAQPPDGVRLSDVARAAALGKTTAHRLLSALVDVGFATREASSQRYHLGFELVRLGQSARRYALLELARPELARLAQLTEDTIFLSIREGAEAVCIDRRVGAFPIRSLTLDIGDRRPLGVGAGSLALLSALPDAEREEAIAAAAGQLGAYPRYSAARIGEFAARSRAAGHALNEGNIVGGMVGVGVAIRDEGGRVVGALSLAAIKERMTPERVEWIVGLLDENAASIAARHSRRRAGEREEA